MTTSAVAPTFRNHLDNCIQKYDLLRHPFYQAWSAGQLTREHLRNYACQYFQHVAAFPTYLSAFHSRLEDGELRRAVLRNLAEEEIEGTAHSDLWLKFAAGFGADADEARSAAAIPEVKELVETFRNIAQAGSRAEALAAFYAYESQVPRVAAEKARGLKEMYGADNSTCSYFLLHRTADVLHANVWAEQLEREIDGDPAIAEQAVAAAEMAAQALWHALDGMERERVAA